MPKVVRSYSNSELQSTFNKIASLDGVSVTFFLDSALVCFGEIATRYSLNLLQTIGLIRVLNAFTFDPFISKTLLLTLLFGSTGKWSKELNEPFNSFFLLTPKGYTLSSTGLSVFATFRTILRRVTCDRMEFFRLKFGRYTPEAREKRRLNKRFYKLPEPEQIEILRQYWSMPYRNKEEQRLRKDKRVELFYKYDLINWDLINAVQRFGDVVKSIRKRPDLIHLFPAYKKPDNT